MNAEERNFARVWSGTDTAQGPRLLVLDVPTAVRDDLLRFLPENDQRPKRLTGTDADADDLGVPDTPEKDRKQEISDGPDPRTAAWTFIQEAPAMPAGGERVGEATSAVTPWPHQVRAFQRLYGNWPPRLLIADEVGLGRTIQAGMLIRQAWLAGKAKRILILAPKAVLRRS